MSKVFIYYFLLVIICIGGVGFFVFKNSHFDNSYSDTKDGEVKISMSLPTYELGGYQSEYAVVRNDEEIQADLFKDDCYAALLVDNETNTALVSHNSLRRIYPASTTKLMTALVVCDALYEGKISLDDNVTLSHDIYIDEEGALVSQLNAGCTISVRNLMYGLLMRSYNDFAIILAEYVAGDVGTFCQMMNDKAAEIGATGSHFCNPHGLHDDNHYVTAYDMYLILLESEKYDIIKEIDSYTSFTYTYTNSQGVEMKDDISPTNQFLAGGASLPSNITIESWKTGTTEAAGNVLAMNVLIDNKPYTMFVADGTSPGDLYDKIAMMFKNLF